MRTDMALLIEANTGIAFGRPETAETKELTEPVRPAAAPANEETHGCRCDRGGKLCSDCIHVREQKGQSAPIFPKQLMR